MNNKIFWLWVIGMVSTLLAVAVIAAAIAVPIVRQNKNQREMFNYCLAGEFPPAECRIAVYGTN